MNYLRQSATNIEHFIRLNVRQIFHENSSGDMLTLIYAGVTFLRNWNKQHLGQSIKPYYISFALEIKWTRHRTYFGAKDLADNPAIVQFGLAQSYIIT